MKTVTRSRDSHPAPTSRQRHWRTAHKTRSTFVSRIAGSSAVVHIKPIALEACQLLASTPSSQRGIPPEILSGVSHNVLGLSLAVTRVPHLRLRPCLRLSHSHGRHDVVKGPFHLCAVLVLDARELRELRASHVDDLTGAWQRVRYAKTFA